MVLLKWTPTGNSFTSLMLLICFVAAKHHCEKELAVVANQPFPCRRPDGEDARPSIPTFAAGSLAMP
jgi:hypothetical protein